MYPSEVIPPELEVCAEEPRGVVVACTDEHLRQNDAEMYRLVVPAGSYYIFARLPYADANRAYFSEFVRCGLSAGCPSHERILVNIAAGQTITGIDPHDWYAP